MGFLAVVGSYAVDLMCRTPRFPERGETVLGGPFQAGPGGKGGNQAVAAARSGSAVQLVTKVGQDAFGKEALKHFEREGIQAEFVTKSGTEATGTALIAVDDRGENSIIVAPGACGSMKQQDVLRAKEAIRRADMLLLQLEISFEAIETAIEQAVQAGVPILLNPAPYVPFPADWLPRIACITPNETEAYGLTGIKVKDEAAAQQAADVLHAAGVATVVITLGEKGVYASTGPGQGSRIEGFKVEAVDTTGAGDAFNGGFAHALSSGMPLKEAIQFGQAAAALSVTRLGAAVSMPSGNEIKAFLNKVF